ncbi:hypothetical protein AA313_de0206589 [Arthrobotrys entomopaga]|nr:hypothetical protein AA313_de0206589 [Arthrobotrys entomopaga]
MATATAASIPSVNVKGPASGNGSPTSDTSPTNNEPVVQAMGNRRQLRDTMLKKLRPLPLQHEWTFWHDKYQAETGSGTAASGDGYATQLKELANLNTIQEFWQVYNNTPFGSLALRDSLLLFKKNVKPIWEDPRNNKGGSWTFRISKTNDVSADFWKEILMMAIGEVLQEVVQKGDDICGVSISVRFNSHLILVWNRDGSNQKSIDAILARILESLPENLKPLPQNYYYKKHSEHKGYKALDSTASTSTK